MQGKPMLNLRDYTTHKHISYSQEDDTYSIERDLVIPFGDLLKELIRIDKKWKYFRTNKENKFYKAAITQMNVLKDVQLKVVEEVKESSNYTYTG